MKQCPRCHKTYSDPLLNFCLEDGELLLAQEPPPGRFDDTPPTVVLDQARVTNPASWPDRPSASPPAAWQPQGVTPFGQAMSVRPDQTIPTIALILGIASLVLVCCYGGIWLGIPAAVLGFIGMRNADRDHSRYGGRGMAVAGMVLGVISGLASVIWALMIVASR